MTLEVRINALAVVDSIYRHPYKCKPPATPQLQRLLEIVIRSNMCYENVFQISQPCSRGLIPAKHLHDTRTGSGIIL